MPGKSNHGKNNTFKLKAKFSFPVLATDGPSGMFGCKLYSWNTMQNTGYREDVDQR
jgi:hypothetical protein